MTAIISIWMLVVRLWCPRTWMSECRGIWMMPAYPPGPGFPWQEPSVWIIIPGMVLPPFWVSVPAVRPLFSYRQHPSRHRLRVEAPGL